MTLLRRARTLEQATADAGTAFLNGIVTTIAGYLANGGLQAVNVTTASKSFTFATGYSVGSLSAAVDQAIRLWASLDTDQLAQLLDTPLRDRGCLSFIST